MREYLNVLTSAAIFQGLEAAGLEAMLGCIGAEIRKVRKGGIVLLAGDRPEHIGIVLTGQLCVFREDPDGNRSLLAAVGPGDIFAEALCCAGVSESPVTVMADTDSAVMRFPFLRVLSICRNSCSFHRRLIENMLKLVAGKNLLLQRRMEVIGLKSVRARVLHYLGAFALRPGRAFTIPLNREELADYLCVERSALSHELMRMKRDGLLEYRKNEFTLKQGGARL